MRDLARRIAAARRLTVVTGAGVSAASGVPTFRGPEGLWKSFRPEDLATPQAFARDPGLVWEWYDWRRTRIAACRPNAAHHVLAEWSGRVGFTLITQNVDGLHERAGTQHIVRYHGSIWYLRCAEPCAVGSRDWEDRTVPLGTLPPACPHCGGLARPAVVWFGEGIPERAASAAQAAAACDVFLSIGTSSVVYPAAGLLYEAKRYGAFTAEINPQSTAAAHIVDMAIAMAAEDALPELNQLVQALQV
jgi:NAD-dependent deacetylase